MQTNSLDKVGVYIRKGRPQVKGTDTSATWTQSCALHPQFTTIHTHKRAGERQAKVRKHEAREEE